MVRVDEGRYEETALKSGRRQRKSLVTAPQGVTTTNAVGGGGERLSCCSLAPLSHTKRHSRLCSLSN